MTQAQTQTASDPKDNGEGAADKPMPDNDQKFQSMVEKAKSRLNTGSETSPHLQYRYRDTPVESQATDDEQSSGESGAISTSGDQDNRTDAVDSTTNQGEGGEPQPSSDQQDQAAISLDEAKAAMKRSQWGDEQINALPESEILRSGEKLYKREQQREENYKEKERIKSMLKEAGLDPDDLSSSLASLLGQTQSSNQNGQDSKSAETQSNESGAGEDIKSSVHQHIDSAMQPLGEDALMGDSADALKKAMTGALDQVIDHYEGKSLHNQAQPANESDETVHQDNGSEDAKPASSELDQIRRQYETLAMDQTMIASGLDQEYSQLKDPETRAKVRDQAKRLVDTDDKGDLYFDESGQPQWHQALRHAAYLHLGQADGDKTDPQQQKADLLNRQRAVSAGQPSPDREAATTHKDTSQMSKMERMTLMAKARQEGKSEQEVQRLRQQIYGRAG